MLAPGQPHRQHRPGVTVLTRDVYSPSRAAARAPSGAATARGQAAARCGLAGPRSEELGFAHDSALEEAVSSEPVSEAEIPC